MYSHSNNPSSPPINPNSPVYSPKSKHKKNQGIYDGPVKRAKLSTEQFITDSEISLLNFDERKYFERNVQIQNLMGFGIILDGFTKFQTAIQTYGDNFITERAMKRMFITSDIDQYILPEEIDTSSTIYKDGCPICLESFSKMDGSKKSDLEPIRMNHCRHIYHKGCIDNWTSFKNTCPVCRGKIY